MVEEIEEDEIASIVKEAINHYYEEWEKYPDRYPEDEHEEFVNCLLGKYATLIEERRDFFFERLPLMDDEKRKIQELCLFLFTKNRPLRYYTGIAFAGYGTDDLFPVCALYTVENFVCEKLKFSRGGDIKIDFHEVVATVIPQHRTMLLQPFSQV